MEENQINPDIVIYGAGAIGATICGWITPVYNKIYLLARGKNAQEIKSKGLTMYQKSDEQKQVINVNVITDLKEKPNAEVVIIAVKNYDLEEVAKDIYSKLGDKPIIVALQNGVFNQSILPKYFSKVIYGVIVVSAWMDDPGVFGYAVKGHIIIGTVNNDLQTEMKKIRSHFRGGFKFKISQNIQDAIHTKLIYNLSNSIITLINHSEISKESALKLGQIYYRTIVEGIYIFETAGFKEHSIPGLGSWSMMKMFVNDAAETLGTKVLNQLKIVGPNSMSQDIIIREKGQSELEHLNGYFIKLAKKFGISAPYNSTIYELCKTHFQKKPFKQLEAEEVWNIIQEKLP